MKPTILEKSYAWILLVIFGGIILHAPLSVGFGTLFPHYELLIKSWKEMLMLIAAILAVVIISKRHLWKELSRDLLFKLIVAYALLHMLLVAVLFQGSTQTAAGLAIDLRYVLFFGLIYILIKTLPQYRRPLIITAIAGAVIVIGFAVLQLFLPADILKYIGYGKNTIEPYLTVDKNPDFIRVNSTLRGPNPLGAYVAIALACFVAAWAYGVVKFKASKDKILTGLFAACSLIALWISYSRSAIIAAVAALGLVVAVVSSKYFTKTVWVGLGVAVIIVAGGLFVAKDSAFVSNVLLHENPNGGSAISSNDGHAESLTQASERAVAQPLGGGIGSTGSASLYGDKPLIVENQYLFIAHETGWLGFGLFVTLFAAIIVRLWRLRKNWLALGVFASGIGLGLIGIIQPVWVDDTVSIIWWGLAGLALAGGNYGKQTKQKTARTT